MILKFPFPLLNVQCDLFIQILIMHSMTFNLVYHQKMSSRLFVEGQIREHTDLDPAVENCQDDAVGEQYTVQHIADLRL